MRGLSAAICLVLPLEALLEQAIDRNFINDQVHLFLEFAKKSTTVISSDPENFGPLVASLHTAYEMFVFTQEV